MVLDIKVPQKQNITTDIELIHALVLLLPKLITYVMSFMTLGIFWMGYVTQTSYLNKSDRNLNWLTIFFLIIVSLMPFSTSFLSEHIHLKIAVWVYWLNVLLCGVALYFQWQYIVAKNFTTLEDHALKEVNNALNRRIVIAQSLYAFGAFLAIWNTYWSVGFILAVQLNYALGLVTKRLRM